MSTPVPSGRPATIRQARPRTPEGRPPSTPLHGRVAPMPGSFTLDEHRLAMRLGVTLRDVSAAPPPCHGYRNCCTCPACRQLERQIAEHRAAGREPFDSEGKVKPPPRKRQPWEQGRRAA